MTDPTRRELLVAGATGALLGPATGALLAPGAAAADGADQKHIPVPERLQRLARLELLLLFCYRHVLASPVISPRAKRTLTPFVAHEERHVEALERELRRRGGTPPPPPASIAAANHDLAHRKVGGRLGQLKGDLDAVRLLLTLEQVTIGAYYVALTQVNDTGLIELICSVMANEAQHDAVLGVLLPPGTPGAAVPYGQVQGLQ